MYQAGRGRDCSQCRFKNGAVMKRRGGQEAVQYSLQLLMYAMWRCGRRAGGTAVLAACPESAIGP